MTPQLAAWYEMAALIRAAHSDLPEPIEQQMWVVLRRLRPVSPHLVEPQPLTCAEEGEHVWPLGLAPGVICQCGELQVAGGGRRWQTR